MEVDLLWGQLDRREKELNMSKIGARCVAKPADVGAQAAVSSRSGRQIIDNTEAGGDMCIAWAFSLNV